MKNQSPAQTTTLALRLASFYGAIFLLIGIFMPFFPVWLKSRQLGEVEISIILAAPLLSRILFTPLISFFADHLGERRRVLIGLSWGSFIALLAFIPTQGFWPLLFIAISFGIFWTSIMPLTEAIAMTQVREQGLDYGRIRLWGSLSFIAATLVAGLFVDLWGEASILYMMLAAMATTILAAYALPFEIRKKQLADTTPLPPIHWRDALKLMHSKLFILFLLTSAGIQATHAVYYSFGTLHWQSLHMAAGLIGALWAVGVLAEVTLFAWSNAVIKRLGPTRLLILAALGAVVRWTLTAFDPPLALLFLVQVLHAASFGAAHLGAIHFIAQAVPEQYSATGQGLYAAFAMGIIMGLMTSISGTLYAGLGGQAYLVMALLGALSLVGALVLDRLWKDEPILAQGGK
ncbi:MAG: 3-phenylpropionate MFS transporter [Hyphomicrobiaceae bacterium]|nr:3-phenylpropionate MFS transporter [Hyphomicrobiaceae bacterium]